MFESLRRSLALPLLGKELLERAVRRRTYVLRWVVGVGFLVAFWLALPESSDSREFGVLGSGGRMLLDLLMIQLGAIFLFLPAMMSSAITYEKERGSLELLLLAGMTPNSILVQKFVGGLVPMLSLLLISLPLGGLAYSYGGVSEWDLNAGLWVIASALFQVGAISLLCSCYCRTSIAALGATYLVTIVVYVGSAWAAKELRGTRPGAGVEWDVLACVKMLFPGYQLVELLGMNSMSGVDVRMVVPFASALVSSLFFLALARYYFLRRAFPSSRPVIASVFRRMDSIFTRLNSLAGGVRFGSDQSMPKDDPVAWRELSRSALGSPRYLTRLAVAGCIIAVPLPLFTRSAAEVLAAVTLLLVIIQGANLIVSERVNQTLEILMTTPMSARDVVLQKWRALGRLIWVLCVPVVVALVCQFALDVRLQWRETNLLHVASWVFALLIYPKMFGWLAILIGLHVRTRARAALVAIGIAVLWFTAPRILAKVFDTRDYSRASSEFIEMLHPRWIISATAKDRLKGQTEDKIRTMAFNFLAYSLLLIAFRSIALHTANEGLRGKQPAPAG